MRFSDALKIAWTKFRARKVRTSLSAIITALVLTMLVGVAFGFNGMRNSISDVDGLSTDKSVVRVNYISEGGSFFGSSPEEFAPRQQIDIAKERFTDYNIVKISSTGGEILSGSLNDITVNGKALDSNSFLGSDKGSFSVSSRPDEYLQKNLYEGQAATVGESGSIPLFLSTNSLKALEGVDLSNKTNEEKITLMSGLFKDYEGKELVVESTDAPGEKLTFTVVGYSPADSLFENFFLGGSSYIPESVLTDELKEQIVDFSDSSSFGFGSEGGPFGPFFPEDGPIEISGNSISDSSESNIEDRFSSGPLIIELSDEEELKKFINNESCGRSGDYTNCTELTIMGNAVLEFDEEFKTIWGFLKYIVYFFAGVATIFIFLTTSKVISESTVETGVFRAMGAKRLDIAKIYLLYTLIITSFAYLLSIIIGLIVMLIVTAKQAGGLSELITNITGSYANVPEVSLIGFNPKHLALIWLTSVVVGLVGGIIPILGNVFKDPIKAMRSE